MREQRLHMSNTCSRSTAGPKGGVQRCKLLSASRRRAAPDRDQGEGGLRGQHVRHPRPQRRFLSVRVRHNLAKLNKAAARPDGHLQGTRNRPMSGSTTVTSGTVGDGAPVRSCGIHGRLSSTTAAVMSFGVLFTVVRRGTGVPTMPKTKKTK